MIGGFRKRFAICVLLLQVGLSGCGASFHTEIARPPNPPPVLEPEHYIWFSSPSSDALMVRFFRKTFSLTSVPAAATLYVAGPYNWDVAVNCQPGMLFRGGGPGLAHYRPGAAGGCVSYRPV